MKEFINDFNKASTNNHSLILVAECEVRYSGRAESHLPKGDRIIILKSDNTLLVHQPKGNNPVNHMREGGQHKIISNKKEKTFDIISEHTKHKEHLMIRIYKIHHHTLHKLFDEEKIITKGTEKDMAEMIFNNPKIISEDFKPLSVEEHTKYGFIDVFGYDKTNTLVIIECKRQTADLKAVTQLRRYVEKIMELKGIKKIRGIIASPDITVNAKDMLSDWSFEWKRIEPPRYKDKFDKKQKRLTKY